MFLQEGKKQHIIALTKFLPWHSFLNRSIHPTILKKNPQRPRRIIWSFWQMIHMDDKNVLHKKFSRFHSTYNIVYMVALCSHWIRFNIILRHNRNDENKKYIFFHRNKKTNTTKMFKEIVRKIFLKHAQPVENACIISLHQICE